MHDFGVSTDMCFDTRGIQDFRVRIYAGTTPDSIARAWGNGGGRAWGNGGRAWGNGGRGFANGGGGGFANGYRGGFANW